MCCRIILIQGACFQEEVHRDEPFTVHSSQFTVYGSTSSPGGNPLPAQWPVERVDHFRDLVRVRALENQMFVAACNSCGDNGKGLVMGGNSMVVNPWGEVPGSLGKEEGVLSVPFDMDQVRKVRERFPVLDYARPDLFGS